MFDSVDVVRQGLADQQYICDKKIATVVFLASKLQKPVLVEGPAGVGKTELAKAVAAATRRNLIRLQCYEGLDEAKALYEWEYSKQLLYTQILKEHFTDREIFELTVCIGDWVAFGRMTAVLDLDEACEWSPAATDA